MSDTYDEGQVTEDMWLRYQYMRDNGHTEFVTKALRCEEFFCGLQWNSDDLTKLRAARRPALTINHILSTISNILGEQIFNRTEVAYRARGSGATDDIADALTKVFMQISDNNELPYVRSDVYADGIITGRGFYDCRLDFTDNLQGETRISRINPKSVLLDPDAETYEVKGWGDVIISRWMAPDEISVLYGKDKGELLKGRVIGAYPFSYDMLDYERDRFGTPPANTYWMGAESMRGMARLVRVIERQWRKLDRIEHFVDLATGDSRIVPFGWDHNRISDYLGKNPNHGVMRKLVQRVRWTVVADNVVLFDDWSPYDDFTVIPFFPHFRSGRTVGLVENLLGPQEYLNKIRSQELHVVNTTANSGWKIKSGSLQNMTPQELEERGAETGLVLEYTGGKDDIDKIQPNQVPSGLDRLSSKANEDFQIISGLGDAAMGMARADASAKAIQANKQHGSSNLAKVADNLQRSDGMLAYRTLDLIQDFYTEQRLIQVTKGPFGGTQQVQVNQMTPEGKIVNDLTLGEYSVIITNQPQRDTYEDNQFDQLVMMKKDLGIDVPPEFFVLNSQVRDKTKLVQALEAKQNSPEAKQDAQLTMRAKVAKVDEMEGTAQSKRADAKLRLARAHKEIAEQLKPQQDPQMEAQLELHKQEQENALEIEKMEKKHAFEMEQLKQKQALELEKHQLEMRMKQESHDQDMSIKQDTALATQAATLAKANQPGGTDEGGTSTPASSGG